MKTEIVVIVLMGIMITANFSVFGAKVIIEDETTIKNSNNLKTPLNTADDTEVKIFITVDYVTNKPEDATYLQNYDPIDPDYWPFTEEPEWYYKITVSDSSHTNIKEEIINKNKDENDKWIDEYTWIVDKTHEFSPGFIHPFSVLIDIELWDDDMAYTEKLDDQADLSAKKDKRTFKASYNFVTNTLSVSDDHPDPAFIVEEDGWYVVHGELDGSTDFDDDDAEMRFKIEDNYEPLSVTIDIENEEILENRNVAPGETVKFICTVEGGLPDFEYHFKPIGQLGQTEEIKTSNQRQITFEYQYSVGDHGLVKPYVLVYDRGGNGSPISAKMDDIYVNRRPEAVKATVDRELALFWKYTAHGSDADGDTLQYRFKINGGRPTEWSSSNIYYHEEMKKLDSFEFQVRDKPGGYARFGDGLESSWTSKVEVVSEEESESIDRSIKLANPLFYLLLEKFPALQIFLLF